MSAITRAVRSANADGRMALAAFVTAGFPSKAAFQDVVPEIAARVDVLEIGVPFSDPMADGVTIQHASFEALKQGVTLDWIFDLVKRMRTDVPVVLMSYLNPLLAFGEERLGEVSREHRVSGFIIPDLPYEESEPIASALFTSDVDLIQLVTPATPDDRMRQLVQFSRGFVYAVTSTGTTGGRVRGDTALHAYLDRVRSNSRVPMMAGFGIRSSDQVRTLAGHVDGVIIGSAIVDALDKDANVLGMVDELREATTAHKEVSL